MGRIDGDKIHSCSYQRFHPLFPIRTDAHRRADFVAAGFRRGSLVKTGDRTFCMLGEWESYDSLAAARPKMIAVLDSFRADLEDLGGGLGVTDPVSGTVVLDLP